MLLKNKNLELHIWLTKNHKNLKDLLQHTKSEEQPLKDVGYWLFPQNQGNYQPFQQHLQQEK